MCHNMDIIILIEICKFLPRKNLVALQRSGVAFMQFINNFFSMAPFHIVKYVKMLPQDYKGKKILMNTGYSMGIDPLKKKYFFHNVPSYIRFGIFSIEIGYQCSREFVENGYLQGIAHCFNGCNFSLYYYQNFQTRQIFTLYIAKYFMNLFMNCGCVQFLGPHLPKFIVKKTEPDQPFLSGLLCDIKHVDFRVSFYCENHSQFFRQQLQNALVNDTWTKIDELTTTSSALIINEYAFGHYGMLFDLEEIFSWINRQKKIGANQQKIIGMHFDDNGKSNNNNNNNKYDMANHVQQHFKRILCLDAHCFSDYENVQENAIRNLFDQLKDLVPPDALPKNNQIPTDKWEIFNLETGCNYEDDFEFGIDLGVPIVNPDNVETFVLEWWNCSKPAAISKKINRRSITNDEKETDNEKSWKWKISKENPKIPYKFNDKTAKDIDLKKYIQQGIDDIEKNTCIKFVYDPNADATKTDYILFVKRELFDYIGTSKSETIGRKGGEHRIWLVKEQLERNGFGTVSHEIGHALGLIHEQSRIDSDESIWSLEKLDNGEQFWAYCWSNVHEPIRVDEIMCK